MIQKNIRNAAQVKSDYGENGANYDRVRFGIVATFLIVGTSRILGVA